MRLALEGDLAEADVRVASADHYDEVLAAGVRRFQERHGFAADGIVGSRTLAALRAPLATRVRQLELALERLRWLPDLGYRRTIVVNIPMFQLWAWDERPLGSLPPIAMDIIVGRARRTRTPVFVESMQEVIFRPYWNVPRSILRNELLPAMRADPAYLSTHHFEVVSGEGNDARPVEVDADALERGTGRLRLRQRPGVANALGPVKFLFPNVEGVYMHGTPTPGLFKRDRRDFSHGCIRVADPAALAVWVLGRTPGWTATRVAEAMASGPLSQSVTLAERIDVVLYYMTAYVRPEDGAVRFAEDIYGHDAVLERALARTSALP